jgi:hypothetical protein
MEMIEVIEQKMFYCYNLQHGEGPAFYRRTILKNKHILWECPSQYGTFTFVVSYALIKELNQLYNSIH